MSINISPIKSNRCKKENAISIPFFSQYCHNLSNIVTIYALSRFWQQNMSKKFCQWDLKKVHSDLGERLFFQSMLEPDIGNNIKFPNFPIPTSCCCLMSIYQITHVIYFGPVFKMRQF